MKPLNKAEELLIEHYILLTLCRQVLERDLKAFSQSSIRMKDPYVHLIEFALTALSKDLYKIKGEQQQKKMTIHRASVSDTFSEYVIHYQGYTYTMTYKNVHLKYQVQDCIEDLFGHFKHASSGHEVSEL
ncbi:hypothetical protein [Salisediminibacterium selenitireducens]|uniref:Uncharacterized protein n=1 Tax=Bacillus selenitireducens (strain ATCC 700615 / DSM 15326 / MLS10) TaxID=439292 RepID=D6XUA6_BACIE|nr:hypothetical protein [Salisediminibacterium selenitireducens]ADH99392.1 hypothetical protein Bsel_1888 [[Bacillus] selenitireducens MLS10]